MPAGVASEDAPAHRRVPTPAVSWGRGDALIAVALVAVVLAVFFPVVGNEFVAWDDASNFVQNRAYRGIGWAQIRWASTTIHMGVYQPLAWILFGAEYSLFGLEAAGYHLTSLLLYVASTLVLFGLTLDLINLAAPSLLAGSGRRGRLCVAACVALFAVHPLRAELVAWVSCQPYLPCALFYLLAVWTYIRAPPQRLLWTYLFALLALLSKAAAVSLPVALLILDVYPLGRLGTRRGWRVRRVWIEKIPLLALSTLFSVLAYVARAQSHDIVLARQSGIAERAAHFVYGVNFYLVQTLWPVRLLPYYPFPRPFGWSQPRVVLGALSFVAIGACVLLTRRRWPGLAAAWLAFLAMLSPHLGFVRLGNQLAADRYTYLPFMGLMVCGAALLLRQPPARQARIGALALAACATMSSLCIAQSRSWRDTLSLWTHANAVAHGREAAPHNGIGTGLIAAGEIEAAAVEFRAALALDPDYFFAHFNLARLLLGQGKPDEAIEHFREAIRLEPEGAPIYADLGDALAAKGEIEAAMGAYETTLRSDPGSASAHNGLGVLLARQGKLDEANAHFGRALARDPDSVDAHRNLALVFVKRGQPARAAEELRLALRLDPGSAIAHSSLAAVLADLGQLDEAVIHSGEAVRLQPTNAEAHFNWGVALARQGHLDAAKDQFSEVLHIDPANREARKALDDLEQVH